MQRGLLVLGVCCQGAPAALGAGLGDSVSLLQLGARDEVPGPAAQLAALARGSAALLQLRDNPVGIPPEVFKAFDIYDKKTRQDAMVFLNITKELEKAWGHEVGKFIDHSVKRQFKLLGTVGKVFGSNAKAVSDKVDSWVADNVKSGKILSDAVDTAKANQNKGQALLRKWWEKNKNWNSLGAGSLMEEGSKKSVVSADALREREIDDAWKKDVAQLLPDLPASVLDEPKAMDFLKWLGDALIPREDRPQRRQKEAHRASAPGSNGVKRWLKEVLGAAAPDGADLSAPLAVPAAPEEKEGMPSWVADLGDEVAKTLKEQSLDGGVPS